MIELRTVFIIFSINFIIILNDHYYFDYSDHPVTQLEGGILWTWTLKILVIAHRCKSWCISSGILTSSMYRYVLGSVHLESCTPGQDWAKWYVLVCTSTYQYKTVQVSTRIPNLYIPVCTSTYRYILLRSQVVFWPTQKESGEMR